MKRIFPQALLAGLWLLPSQAAAQSMTCHARIDDFNFGTLTLAGGDVTPQVAWRCDRNSLPEGQGANIRMCFFISKGSAAMDVNPRWMQNENDPQALISYDIFADSGRTQKVNPVDSEGLPMSFTVQLPINAPGAEGAIPIYGRLYPQVGTVPFYHYNDNDLHITPIHARYNLSGPAPSVDECLNGGGDGEAAISFIDTFNVHVQIENMCTIGIATDLDFGEVSSIAIPYERMSTIHLNCPSDTNWRLGLNDGQHIGGDGERRMANAAGTEYVPYELYRDELRQQRWGNTPGTDTNDGTGADSMQQVTVYGRTLPQSPTPPAGLYSDTITVTLTF